MLPFSTITCIIILYVNKIHRLLYNNKNLYKKIQLPSLKKQLYIVYLSYNKGLFGKTFVNNFFTTLILYHIDRNCQKLNVCIKQGLVYFIMAEITKAKIEITLPQISCIKVWRFVFMEDQ